MPKPIFRHQHRCCLFSLLFMFSAVFSGQVAAQELEATAVSHVQEQTCPKIKLKDSCKKLLAGSYEVRGRGAVRLIANPHWNAKTDLSMYGNPCRVKLERPWKGRCRKLQAAGDRGQMQHHLSHCGHRVCAKHARQTPTTLYPAACLRLALLPSLRARLLSDRLMAAAVAGFRACEEGIEGVRGQSMSCSDVDIAAHHLAGLTADFGEVVAQIALEVHGG